MGNIMSRMGHIVNFLENTGGGLIHENGLIGGDLWHYFFHL